MHWHEHWWKWPMMGMGLFWILLIALVIAAVVWAVRSGSSSSRAGPPGEPRGESPEETLKRRYAQGEISREEYEQTLSDLRR